MFHVEHFGFALGYARLARNAWIREVGKPGLKAVLFAECSTWNILLRTT
jgi:hypothetical protein